MNTQDAGGTNAANGSLPHSVNRQEAPGGSFLQELKKKHIQAGKAVFLRLPGIEAAGTLILLFIFEPNSFAYWSWWAIGTVVISAAFMHYSMVFIETGNQLVLFEDPSEPHGDSTWYYLPLLVIPMPLACAGIGNASQHESVRTVCWAVGILSAGIWAAFYFLEHWEGSHKAASERAVSIAVAAERERRRLELEHYELLRRTGEVSQAFDDIAKDFGDYLREKHGMRG